ncbi:MAG TPA: hypothetical protein VMT32_09855 [Bryobacteraceae bacterium]|nr:hypothetical protein [Bryobacteraceae bacterium]
MQKPRKLRHSDGMPVVILRVMMGAFCVLFAYAFGKSAIRFRRGRERRSRTIAWALRTIVTGLAAAWRAGFDLVTLAVVTLAALSFAGGAYVEWRPKHEEELDRIIFPPE